MSALWLAAAAVVLAMPLPGRVSVRLPGVRARAVTLLRSRTRLGGPVGASYRPAPFVRNARLWPHVAAASVGGLGVAAGRLSLGVAGAVLLWITLSGIRDRLLSARRRRDEESLHIALQLLEAELAIGARECDALRAAAQVTTSNRDTLLAAGSVAALGGDVGASLATTATRIAGGASTTSAKPGETDLLALASAWRVRAVCGAPLAGVVGKVRKDAELRAARSRDAAAALAGPRSSAGLLAALPGLGLALGTAMGARPVPFLVGSDRGSVVLLAGVCADAAGVVWIRYLIRRAERP